MNTVMSTRSERILDFLSTLPEKSRACIGCVRRFLLARENQSDKVPTGICDNVHKDEAESKAGQNCGFCSLCLGLVDEGQMPGYAKTITKYIHQMGYDCDTFAFNVTIPHLLEIRKFSMSVYLKDNLRVGDDWVPGQITVKDYLKENLVPIVEELSGKKFSPKGSLQVNVSFTHAENTEEERKIFQVSSAPVQKRRKVEEEDITWGKLSSMLIKLPNTAEFSKYYPCPPERLYTSCSLSSISTVHDSIFIGGRYNKFSRDLSQTPWIVDGKRHGTTSVQELICNPIKQRLKAEDVKFMSSGREDVDVLMLGQGRPFAAEFADPKSVKLSNEDLQTLQDEINSNTFLVKVNHLRLLSRDDLKILKEGEEEKTKSYRALIYAPSGVSKDALTKLQHIKGKHLSMRARKRLPMFVATFLLNGALYQMMFLALFLRLLLSGGEKELVTKQKTPIRVLHRRPLAVREKTIYSMSAAVVDEYHFHLYLTTQAGTYIKEFVHGDFGRTIPSLGILLEQETDIMELDVMDVNLPWPPGMEETI